MKDQCPNCGKANCVSENARSNVEIYGSKTLKVACTHCGAPLLVTLRRKVILENIAIGNFKRDDWNTPCKFTPAQK